MSNPLLSNFNTLHQVAPFESISEAHFKEGIMNALEEAKKEIDAISNNKATPTFENTIEALEYAGEKLQRNASILSNLNAAETSENLQKTAQAIFPKLSAFNSEVKQNEHLFDRVKTVFEHRLDLGLNAEQMKLLEDTYTDFVRRGVELEGENKERFKQISIELSKLSLSFSENVLAETNDYELVIDCEEDLSGLPADVVARAASRGMQKGKEGCWIFTLQAPSYIPFMEYADNRRLREKLYKAQMSKCLKGNERDNQELILTTIRLKAELASLLGHNTFADYVLEQRMAENKDHVLSFLQDLLAKSLPKAKEEVEEIKSFMKSKGADHALQRWDWAYYSEKLRKEKYAFDDEWVKPYFKLENVIEGMFKTAELLFDIRFEKNTKISVYHKEVEGYEVKNEKGEVVAVFLTDFFPREGKRSGAWMTSFRKEKKVGGQKVIPHISIVCNFTPSADRIPSLLKFDEVRTLFHEFGHALHGILADTTYASLSGTSVYCDFVELPSQIMENWCYEKECLDLFAFHFETGDKIPQELIEKIRIAATYHEAYATVRQISFGLLDMHWHGLTLAEANSVKDVTAFEKRAFEPTELLPSVPETNMSVQFSHLFAGGYAAGYYSYKWAEVLDADAFALFQERGIFDKETARSFKENILSRGGTEHPMTLYKKYRGQAPKVDYLLKRAGLMD